MKRSKFNLGHTQLLSCDMGELVPCGIMEVLPGDSVQQSTTALVRCAPMLAPPMHPIDVRIHHWFVPHRLVWSSWENFITGGPDGNNASVFPTVTVTPAVGSLADYLGLPTGTAQTVSALPFRAYGLIWNEWYRDQDLQNKLTVSVADGNDTTTNTTLQNCAWEKDYFTSARPWEVKGPAVTIPITMPTAQVRFYEGAATRTIQRGGGSAGAPVWVGEAGGAGGTALGAEVPSANLSSAGITVNQLRQSLAIQRYEEAAARYGSRYQEYLARLGVRSSDQRLQRPEYLGGGRQRLAFSEVLQTAPDATTGVVGTLRGHGITAVRSNAYRRFFEEHGYVLTLMSARPKTIYASGQRRHWTRRTKYDFWQKELQHIGQQPVLNKEVYAASGTPDGTFGYQDRYDEYRRVESGIAGEFRSLLNYWHFARVFGSAPALNSSFVSCVPTEVPFAVSSEDVLQIQAKHSIVARRLVAQNGTSFTF